jgi:cytochrome c oxidase assembly factor CtaG
MTDPRYSDQHSDQRLSDPVLRQDDRIGGVWAWIAGLAVLALIAFVVVAGWNSERDAASTSPSAPTSTSSAPARSTTPPSTTGSSATSPQPVAPAPANRGQ